MQQAVERLPEHCALLGPAALVERVDVRTALLVHLVMSWRHRDRDEYVDESVAQLATQTGQSERAVRRALKALDRAGLWPAVEHGNQHHGTRRVPAFVSGYPQQQRPPERPQQPLRPSRWPEQSDADEQRPPEWPELNGELRPLAHELRPQQRPLAHGAAATQVADTKDKDQSDKAPPPSRVTPTSEPTNVDGWGIEQTMTEAVALLVRHRAVVIGEPRDPSATRKLAERDCAFWRDDALAWLADGRRPYDIARSVAARANGETTSRPPTRAELGLL